MSKKKKLPHYTDNLYKALDSNNKKVFLMIDVDEGKLIAPTSGFKVFGDILTLNQYLKLEDVLHDLYMDLRNYKEDNI